MTGLARQWAQDGTTNAGVTLARSGALVRFASALGVGADDPSVEPYLDISYSGGSGGGSSSAVTTNAVAAATAGYNSPSNPYYDTAPFIYGIGGGYTADTPRGGANALPGDATGCATNGITCGTGAFRLSAASHVLGAQYVRFGVQLACASYQGSYGINPAAPGVRWWNSNDATKFGDYNATPIDANQYNFGTISDLLKGANAYHLIPVVVFTGNVQCPQDLTPALWQNQVRDFVSSYLYGSVVYPTAAPIYFEVGNEPNLKTSAPQYTNDPQGFAGHTPGTYHFPSVFAYAARGLQAALQPASNAYKYTRYRILVGGMYAPSPSTTASRCIGGSDSPNHIDFYEDTFSAGQAIDAATSGQAQITLPAVSRSRLGLAVHPYSYAPPPISFYFRNWYSTKDTSYTGKQTPMQVHTFQACNDLTGMLKVWTGSGSYGGSNSAFKGATYNFKGLPLFFSEVNYLAGKGTVPTHLISEGTYLADLFTYLYDTQCVTYKGRCTRLDPSVTPIRVAVFSGMDGGAGKNAVDDGMYTNVSTNVGGAKAIRLRVCDNRAIKTAPSTIARNYYYLRNGTCY